MPYYVTVEKPLILSKHKTQLIPEGRPLSPLSLRQPTAGSGCAQLKSPFTTPTTSLADYQKLAHENLIKINNNLSKMLQETFSGIDGICKKVRLCLLEANTKVSDMSEQCTTMDIYSQTCCEDNEEDDEASDKDVQSTELEVDQQQEEDSTPIDTNNDETELLNKSPRLPPFFTIVNSNTSQDSVGVKLINSISSKLGLEQKCTAENFQKTMKKVDNLPNYDDVLVSMVDGVNEEIDTCYLNCQKIRGDARVPKNKRPRTTETGRRPKEGKKRKYYSMHEMETNRPAPNEDGLSSNDLMREEFSRQLGKHDIESSKLEFPCSEVYRKRAITDLHGRMHAQLEANDSLVFFQRLMRKNRKHLVQNQSGAAPEDAFDKEETEKAPTKNAFSSLPNERRPKYSVAQLLKKYQGSLWFKPRKSETKRVWKESRSRTSRDKKTRKSQHNFPQTYSLQSGISYRQTSTTRKSGGKTETLNKEVTVINNQPLSESERCKLHWMRAKYSQLSHKKLKYLDILDDITQGDLVPIKAEYPRRDDIVKISDVRNSYLYKMLHGKGPGNEWIWEQLISAGAAMEFGQSNNVDEIETNTSPIDKLKETCFKSGDFEESATPTRKRPRSPTKSLEASSPSDRGQVCRTLSKYIFGGEVGTPRMVESVFTVMPVHVFYDNLRMEQRKQTDPPPQKLLLLPMKETKKGVRTAQWTNDAKQSRPMRVVYDPILRKIDKEIKMISARRDEKLASSWSPKNFDQYCKNPQGKSTERFSVKNHSKERVSPETGGNSRPVQIAELFKRTATSRQSRHTTASSISSELDSHPKNLIPFCVNVSTKKGRANINQELEVKKSIQRDIKMQALKMKSEQERKLWQNKYGKSVGQKLLNFIEKQPSSYEPSVPKHASPRPVKNPAKQQQMLAQLCTLKEKNENIQTNIQKAIQVIENKMVDILGKPTTTESIEAFDEMEKEITNVLSAMKTPTSKETKKKQRLRANESDSEVDRISEELFKKLDKILESPLTSDSPGSSINSKINAPESLDAIIPKSSDMNKVCFSSTSASGEEKFTITAISPKRGPKMSILPPYLKTDDTENTAQNELSNIRSELRKLHKELADDSLELNPCNEPTKVQEGGGETSKQSATQANNTVRPIHEQVVNLALINTTNKCPAGDHQLGNKLNPKSDKSGVACFAGNGDSGDELKPIRGQRTGNLQTKTQAELAREKPQSVELSEPYFTPMTSPVIGNRDATDVEIPDKVDDSNETQSEVKESFEPLCTVNDESKDLSPGQHQREGSGERSDSSEKISFCENVHKIISRVESVYNQLEELEDDVSADKTRDAVPKQRSIKMPNLQGKSAAPQSLKPDSQQKSPRMHRSPSYFNVINFLDTLADFKEEKPIEVYVSRIVDKAYAWQTPTVVYQSKLQQESAVECALLPKKKSGCLKNPSSHLNVNTDPSRSRQKVSFLLQKEEKATQVTVCPLHSKLKERKDGSDVSTQLSELKRQVKDNVSESDDTTYQSTLEASEVSSDRSQINQRFNTPKIFVDEKKDVVELFRNNGCEEKRPEIVKVFYDNYQRKPAQPEESLTSGSFNENSLAQVTKSLSPDKKRATLQKIGNTLDAHEDVTKFLDETDPLIEPLKNLNIFIDAKLLKDAIEQRQKVRMSRRHNLVHLLRRKKQQDSVKLAAVQCSDTKNERFLKGIYVLVYFFVFSALNLEYKCGQ